MATKGYIEIGKGTFGIVFQHAYDERRIVKRTIQPNVDPRQWLPQHAKWHDRIFSSLGALAKNLHIETTRLPHFFGLKNLQNHSVLPWLDAAATLEDQEYREIESPVLQARKIPVISTSIRETILDRLLGLDDELIKRTLRTARNQDCLLRAYFGKEETECEGRVKLVPGLRDFSLGRARLAACLNDMDYVRLLEILANTMASLHWYVGCDARDVEFVLGGTDHMSKSRPLLIFGQSVEVWLLDFNQVTEITMDIEGARKAADAFVDNDPYFPKSNRDQVDWFVFKSAYVGASVLIQQYKANTEDFIPEGTYFDLPVIFCKAVERKMNQNLTQNIAQLP